MADTENYGAPIGAAVGAGIGAAALPRLFSSLPTRHKGLALLTPLATSAGGSLLGAKYDAAADPTGAGVGAVAGGSVGALLGLLASVAAASRMAKGSAGTVHAPTLSPSLRALQSAAVEAGPAAGLIGGAALGSHLLSRDAYSRGEDAAEQSYGVKLNSEDPDKDTRRNALMAAAAAAPWAGTIGQEPLRHADTGQAMSRKALIKRMRPGDVLITGAPDISVAKGAISSATGTPKGYHIAVVGNDGKILESHPSYGFARNKMPGRSERIQVLRPQMTNKERAAFMRQLNEFERLSKSLEANTARALPKKTRHLADMARASLYEGNAGVAAGIKDLFLPKLRSEEAAAASREGHRKARDAAQRAMKGHGKQFAEAILSEGARADRGLLAGDIGAAAQVIDAVSELPVVGRHLRRSRGYVSPENLTRVLPSCVGGVCSSLPATMLPFDVVPGKMPSDVIPSDYLRSAKFTSVGRFDPLKGKTLGHEHVLQHAPTMARLGVGAGLAGAVYAGDRYLRNRAAKKKKGHK